jgi:hypothetical protein
MEAIISLVKDFDSKRASVVRHEMADLHPVIRIL